MLVISSPFAPNQSLQPTPLALAMRTFDFMKPFREFGSLAPTSGG
jgi:hypothetical protein